MPPATSFILFCANEHVDIPLQAVFRINTENMGQFERIPNHRRRRLRNVRPSRRGLPRPVDLRGCSSPWRRRPVARDLSVQFGEFQPRRSHRVTAEQIRVVNGGLFTFTPTSPANAFSVTAEHPLLSGSSSWVSTASRGTAGSPGRQRQALPVEPAVGRGLGDVADGDFLHPKPQPARSCQDSSAASRIRLAANSRRARHSRMAAIRWSSPSDRQFDESKGRQAVNRGEFWFWTCRNPSARARFWSPPLRLDAAHGTVGSLRLVAGLRATVKSVQPYAVERSMTSRLNGRRQHHGRRPGRAQSEVVYHHFAGPRAFQGCNPSSTPTPR